MSRGHRPSEPRPLHAHQGNFDEVAARRALRCLRHSENLAQPSSVAAALQ